MWHPGSNQSKAASVSQFFCCSCLQSSAKNLCLAARWLGETVASPDRQFKEIGIAVELRSINP
ncbi:hypothetical protein H6F70_13830 [Coleofasciculus sp. FACHB-T130]|nr:hypothetical protein [Coleofasciculus sp. FACHB-T130]MBD1901964.1 hypothetical protein [Coleofasciculus sp. FACHB-125]